MAGRVGQCLDETLRCVLPVLLANRTGQQSEDVGDFALLGDNGNLLHLEEVPSGQAFDVFLTTMAASSNRQKSARDSDSMST